MRLTALPAFADNYIWMVDDGVDAWVVDPGQADPVIEALRERGLRLRGILVTHHHPDHVGGLEELRALAELQEVSLDIWGPDHEAIQPRTHTVSDGQAFSAGAFQVQVLAVPGHTLTHLAFLLSPSSSPGPGLLFCGDTLFSGGCGRLFEGTPAQMHESLQRLGALPADTQVCCAHEYTLSNLRFALAVDPSNADLLAYEVHCQEMRSQGRPTLPSQLGLELAINPFLRCEQEAVRQAAERHAGQALGSASEVLGALRAWKNQF